ncbi:TPA: hypothetical protein ACG7NT_001961, partial [Escherichia coli]
ATSSINTSFATIDNCSEYASEISLSIQNVFLLMVHFISCPTKKPIALNMVIVGCCNNSSTNISSASSPSNL